MEEQPVAFAISSRSPKSCVSSLIYGVSPQPAQAPENSNSGSSNCESFTCVCASLLRSNSGSDRKNSQFTLSGFRKGAWFSMLIALCFTSLLLLAGQTSTHNLQPVQSSGATCSVYFSVSNSRQRGFEDLKVSGASFSSEESYTLARITAWGQTNTHLPHWMHKSSSQTGISLAMLRFSHMAVPVGKVPSMGIALTGSESPFPVTIVPKTSRTNFGACGDTAGSMSKSAVTLAGTFTSCMCASAASTAALFFCTTASPRLPY